VDDEDFRFVKMPAVQSMIGHWTKTVPGPKDLKWTKSRVAEYLNLGGIAGKIVGGPKTVVDQLERWADVAGVDGFILYNLVNPGTFEDIIEFVLPKLGARGLFREKLEQEGLIAREFYLGVGNDRLLADPGSMHK
jgi:alkanesulfonate monooxygenase SsuD/methylene tetrahydromethanopterin reductase-like flavin-dependent oxidoreductase (luciferase family)